MFQENADCRIFLAAGERGFCRYVAPTAADARASGPRQAARAGRDVTRRPPSHAQGPAWEPGGDRCGSLRRRGCLPQEPVRIGTRAAVPFAPVMRTQQESQARWPSCREKELLFAFGACHLRAFGLWKLVHRSTLRQRPGVPGNALRRIFRCLPVMGPGQRQAGLQGLGRCGRSQPFWRIEKWLTSA